MENMDLMTAIEAAEKYDIAIEKILTAVQLRWLRYELYCSILFVHEKEFRQLLRQHKTEYIQTTFDGFGGEEKRIEPTKKGRRKANE